MNSKVVFVFAFYLIVVLLAKEQLEPGSKGPKGNQGDSNSPSYTDDEIIAAIKKELKEREHKHEYFDPESTIMPMDFDFFSSTMELFDSKSKDNKDGKSKDNKYSIDQLQNKAWLIFGDDLPAILGTMDKLNEAKTSLNSNEYMNYGQYIANIKNKIDELLYNYNIVYSQTNELIELIGNIYTITHENDNIKRLLLNEKSDINNKYDNDLNDVENKAWKTFGDDIVDIKKTMKQIKDSMNDIKYFNISEEHKLSLENKMMELLNSYDNIIENTNQLIEMIKRFYLIARNN